eukprot:gene7425-10118_t
MDINKSNPTNWIAECCQRLKIRNNSKILTSYEDVISSHNLLYNKSAVLDNRRVTLKHISMGLEREMSESDKFSYSSTEAISMIRTKLESIFKELEPWNNNDNEKPSYELSKMLYESKKLIKNQNNEILVAKNELNKTIEQLLELQQQHDIDMQTISMYKSTLGETLDDMSSKDKRIRILEEENEKLIHRILSEKNKSADELNEMNKMISDMNGRLSEVSKRQSNLVTSASSLPVEEITIQNSKNSESAEQYKNPIESQLFDFEEFDEA